MSELQDNAMTTQPIIQNPVLQTYTMEDIGNLINQINVLKQQMKKVAEENELLKTQLLELKVQNRECYSENPANFSSRPLTPSSEEEEITESQKILIEQKRVNSSREIKRLITGVSRPLTPFTLPAWEEEEEMATKETEWTLNENKKRKMNSPPIRGTEKGSTKAVSGSQTYSTKADKPPPAIVYTKDINQLNIALKDIEHKKTCINEDKVKINTTSSDDYRKMTAALNLNHFEWFTYENKQTRDIKVMARNLHFSTDEDDILDDLTQQGFEVKSVVQKLRITKGPNGERYEKKLPLFMLTFSDRTDIKKVYEIKYINSMKVAIEALRTNKMIPQCKKCQEYGHTKVYCRKSPRCVKCAGEHLTVSCEKPRNVEAKCVNCQKNHPANYRGCEVAKILQQKRDQNSSKKQVKEVPKEAANQKQGLTNTKVTPNLTFAQSVKNNTRNESEQNCKPEQNGNDNEMHKLIKLMMQKFDSKFEMLEKSNKALSNRLNSFENRIPSNKNKFKKYGS